VSTAASLIRAVKNAAAQRGVRAEALLLRAGIDPAIFDDRDARVPTPAYLEALRAGGELARDPCFGLTVAGAMDGAAFGALAFVMASCATLREALHRFARYTRLLCDELRVDVIERGSSASIVYVLEGVPPEATLFEMALCHLVSTARKGTNDAFQPRAIVFSHHAPPRSLPKALGAPVELGGAQNAVICDRAALDLPLRGKNATLLGILERHVEQVLFTESAPGKWWTLGMDVDVVRRRLWVCAMDDRSPNPRAGFIWIFDLKTGKRIANHDLSKAAADATCTDVALTKDGTGYVGDREAGNLYKVDVATGASLFAQSPDLAASFVGQNSLVVLPDESALLSLLYLPSGLVRVDLNDASVKPVDITGKFSDLTPLHGADGMVYANGSVYVAFTQKLIRVKPTLGDWSAATSTNVDIPNGMTDLVNTPNGLYLLNGQSVRFALGQAPDPFQLVRFTGSL
jgi:hypothetical protein